MQSAGASEVEEPSCAQAGRTWLSLHVYCSDHDQLILESIDPLTRKLVVNSLVENFFFIRYLEGGAHVRLRLSCLHPELTLVERLARDEIEPHLHHQPSRRQLARTPSAEVTTSPSLLTCLEDPSSKKDGVVERAEYHPEWSRYGGTAGVAIAESIFKDSSELAISVLRQISGQPTRRLPTALRVMGVIVGVFCRERRLAAAFLRSYRAHAGAVMKSLGKDFGPEPTLDQNALRIRAAVRRETACWFDSNGFYVNPGDDLIVLRLYRQLGAARDAIVRATNDGRLDELSLGKAFSALPHVDRVLTTLAASHLHMTNNRLGVPLHAEAVLASVLADALDGGADIE